MIIRNSRNEAPNGQPLKPDPSPHDLAIEEKDRTRMSRALDD